MRPGADEDPVGRRRIADPHDLEVATLRGLADRRDPCQRMTPDRFEQAGEIRQPVRFHARDVQRRAAHFDRQLDAVARQALGGHRLPDAAVVGDRHGLQLAGHGSRLPVPDVVQVQELERELRPGTGVEQEVDVAGGPVRRGALVVVDQMNPHDAVGDVIPERRRVLDAGVDEVQRGAAIRRRGLQLPAFGRQYGPARTRDDMRRSGAASLRR